MPGNHWLDRWSSNEDAVALDSSLTVAQAAEQLGRTVAAVKGRRQRLRGTSTYAQRHQVLVAPGRAGWLIAKTCFGCGMLRPATDYYRRPERMGSWSVKCVPCHLQESRQVLAAAQLRSQRTAVSNGEGWTHEAVIQVLRRDLPISDLAAEIGRTYAATVAARTRARKWLRPVPDAAELLQIDPAQIRGWILDGRLHPAGSEAGHPLYRVGDIWDLLVKP